MTALILLIALIVRLVLINQSLWLDESLEALALQGYFGPIMRYALYDFQPPLYHLIGIAWTKIAGYSEIALRIPSLISGLGVVYFSIKIGEHIAGRQVGRLAGWLASTNPLLVYYSQEGRTYEMTAFFVTASFYYLLILMKSKDSPTLKSKIFYLISTIAALWTSYIAWIVVGLQCLYLIYKKQYRLVAYGVGAFATLLLWIPSLLQSLGIGLSTTVSSPEWGKVVGGISGKALALTWIKMNIGRISFDNNFVYGGIVVILACMHAYILRKASKLHPLLIVWIVGPVSLAALISFVVPVYSYFRVLFIIPSYLLILAIGLSHIRRIWFYVLIALNLIFLIAYWLSPRFHREDWRALTRYINASEKGAVAMPSLNQSAPLSYYKMTYPTFEPKMGIVSSAPEVVYYVKYVEDLFDGEKQGITNLTHAGYRIQQEKSFSGLQLVIYTKGER